MFHLADYYQWVEEGRRPGKQPPFDHSSGMWVIERWLEVKQNIANPIDHKIPHATNKQIAYLISRKIGREGTQGKHSLRNAKSSLEWDAIIMNIKELIAKQILDYLNKEVKDALSQ